MAQIKISFVRPVGRNGYQVAHNLTKYASHIVGETIQLKEIPNSGELALV